MSASSALLVLEDGSCYQGEAIGATETAYGEVVFNTSMTGYQEMLTDPSYAGQIVVPTYPIMGNYGVNADDVESVKIRVAGFVVRDHCTDPSHWQSQSTLDEYLRSQRISGISGVDTRAITRRLRTRGVMMGLISYGETVAEALDVLRSRVPRYETVDFVKQVSATEEFVWDNPGMASGDKDGPHVVVIDCGLKYSILRLLVGLGCRVTAIPVETPVDEILRLKPDGVVLSPGPGDPVQLSYLLEVVKGLIGKTAIMGICLGHQLLARAMGAKTFKLKFGHRGANHPVKDLTTGRVYITAQNHGYAVDTSTLPPELEVTHISLNDGTAEGFRHKTLPVFSIQYHSEASPGPMDNVYLFERFVEEVERGVI